MQPELRINATRCKKIISCLQKQIQRAFSTNILLFEARKSFFLIRDVPFVMYIAHWFDYC